MVFCYYVAMTDVVIGKGKLAGKGVYAARDFKKGEVVVPYNLKELSQEDFNALPEGEWAWTHSFWGKIYLFPEPGRYVNNSKNPTTYPDLERRADIALRDIKVGEPITIDASIELQHELETFLEAYEKAANSRDFGNVASMIADDAVFEFTDGTFKGKDAIQKAFEDTWTKIQDEAYTLSDITWNKASYWSATCSYNFTSDGVINGKRQVYKGKGISELRRKDGNWRIIRERLVKL